MPASLATCNRFDETQWLVRLAVPGDQLEAAPALAGEPVGVLLDKARRDDISAFYDTIRGEDRARPGVEPGREMLFRLREVIGAEVRPRTGGEPVAVVEDLLLDAEGRVAYAVLGRGELEVLIPIPAEKLSIESDPTGERVAIEAALSRDRIDRAPKLEGDWNKMLNGSFVAGVTNYFADVPSAKAP